MITLVLLPGLDGTGTLFADLVAALGAEFDCRVVAYPPDQVMGYAELQGFVRERLPRDRPYLLLGESFSGPLAITLAAEVPPGLSGVILSCSFARNPVPWLRWSRGVLRLAPVKQVPAPLLDSLLMGRFATPRLRDALRASLAAVSAPVLRERGRAVLAVDVSARLAAVRMPLLYLRARQDRVVPAAAADWVARLAGNVQIAELDGPHFLLQVLPVAAAQVVAAFAQQCMARGLPEH